jgi:hypothetical protein
VYPDFGKIKIPAKSRLPTDSCTEPFFQAAVVGSPLKMMPKCVMEYAV